MEEYISMSVQERASMADMLYATFSHFNKARNKYSNEVTKLFTRQDKLVEILCEIFSDSEEENQARDKLIQQEKTVKQLILSGDSAFSSLICGDVCGDVAFKTGQLVATVSMRQSQQCYDLFTAEWLVLFTNDFLKTRESDKKSEKIQELELELSNEKKNLQDVVQQLNSKQILIDSLMKEIESYRNRASDSLGRAEQIESLGDSPHIQMAAVQLYDDADQFASRAERTVSRMRSNEVQAANLSDRRQQLGQRIASLEQARK